MSTLNTSEKVIRRAFNQLKKTSKEQGVKQAPWGEFLKAWRGFEDALDLHEAEISRYLEWKKEPDLEDPPVNIPMGPKRIGAARPVGVKRMGAFRWRGTDFSYLSDESLQAILAAIPPFRLVVAKERDPVQKFRLLAKVGDFSFCPDVVHMPEFKFDEQREPPSSATQWGYGNNGPEFRRLQAEELRRLSDPGGVFRELRDAYSRVRADAWQLQQRINQLAGEIAGLGGVMGAVKEAVWTLHNIPPERFRGLACTVGGGQDTNEMDQARRVLEQSRSTTFDRILLLAGQHAQLVGQLNGLEAKQQTLRVGIEQVGGRFDPICGQLEAPEGVGVLDPNMVKNPPLAGTSTELDGSFMMPKD